LALAAGFALAAVGGALLGWQFARVHPTSVGANRLRPPRVADSVSPSGEVFAVPETPDFLATRVALERTYQQRLALLAPATRQRVEQDLATIRDAIADIRKALAADPESAVLNHLLASTLHEEFDLYSTVIRNTAAAVQRNPS